MIDAVVKKETAKEQAADQKCSFHFVLTPYCSGVKDPLQVGFEFAEPGGQRFWCRLMLPQVCREIPEEDFL
jgi:hypothetical protein